MSLIKLEKNEFVLHPSGAVYWRDKQTWLLADVHLGKTAHFRKHGIAVPRNVEGEFYQKMASLLPLYPTKRITFLGDLFHSFQNNEWYLFEAWVKKQVLDIILIEGNHDIIPDKQFEKLGIRVLPKLEEAGFYFSHYPDQNTESFVICGHLHPGVKLHGKGRQLLKLPCFFMSEKQLILPAFGAFTGLHIIVPKEGDTVFVTTGKEVVKFEKKI